MIKQLKDIKIYIPVKFKTNICGYWADNTGKLYKDNIIINTIDYNSLLRIKDKLFKNGEKAIFYIINNIAYIESINDCIILKKYNELYLNVINEKIISYYCINYGGLTIFEIDNKYKLAYWGQ